MKGISIFAKLIMLIITTASPEIKKMLSDFLDDLEKKAAATANPIDDVLVAALKMFLSLK